MNAIINQSLNIPAGVKPLTFYPYTDNAKLNVPAGFRNCVVSWKLTEEKKKQGHKARASVYCMLPTLNITVQPTSLQGVLQEAFFDMQDKAAAAWLNAQIIENTSINIHGLRLPDNFLTIDGMVEIFTAERESRRLSKEMLENWFDQCLSEPLATALIERNLELAENLEKLNNTLEAYKKAVCNLASPRLFMKPKDATALLKAVNLATDGVTKMQLTSRLELIMKPKEEILVDALG